MNATPNFAEKMALLRAAKRSRKTNPDISANNVSASHGKEIGQSVQSYAPQSMDSLWVEMATQRSIQLPQHATPCTTGGMEKWLRRFGLTLEWFQGYTGMTRLSEWPKRNPTWNLRGFVGLLLEEI